jgi:hypothetical protein
VQSVRREEGLRRLQSLRGAKGDCQLQPVRGEEPVRCKEESLQSMRGQEPLCSRLMDRRSSVEASRFTET